jgi:hypothetical protein
MTESIHTYEARIWEHKGEWHAKVLRNGVFFDHRNSFEDRDEALEWARQQVEQDKAYVEAERKAESVTL